MKRQLYRGISLISWGLICLIAFFATALLAAKLLLPYLDDYKHKIEDNLSQLTGYQVTIGSIGGRLEGVDPTVSINDLALSIHGQSAASVSEIRVRLDALKSIATLSPQFTYVRFVKPEVSLEEHKGVLNLKGAPPSSDVKSDVGVERVLSYLTAQQRFSALNAKVMLQSDQYGLHSIAIPSAYIFQQSLASWIKANIYVDGNAVPFSVDAKIYQSLGVFGAYQVDANIHVPNLSIPLQGKEKAESWTAELDKLNLSGNLWLNYRVGEGFSLQSQALKVATHFKDGESYHAMPAVRVRYAQRKIGLSVDVDSLSIENGNGEVYPSTNLSYEWVAATNSSYLRFDQFDLSLAHQLSGHFLSPEWQVTKLINGLSPVGLISNASLQLSSDSSGVSYHFLSNLQNASIQGYQGIPSANHLDAVFRLDNGDGSIRFRTNKTDLSFPTLYDHGWKVSDVSGVVDWQQVQNTLVITGNNLALKRNNSEVKGGFRFESRQDAPDWISLSLSGNNIPVGDRLSYLPNGALDDSLYDWIKAAFPGKGDVSHFDLLVQTDLSSGATPDVRLKMKVQDAEVHYDKNWPVANDVAGQFTLNEKGVNVRVDSAQVGDMAVSGIDINVPIKNQKADWLTIKGQLTDDSNKVLAFLKKTPLSNSVLKPFETWRVNGDVQGDFSVSVPLAQNDSDPLVDLNLRFSNNPVYIGDINLNATIDKGQFKYSSSKGVYDSEFDVKAFSGASHLTLSSSFEQNKRLSVSGKFSGGANLYRIAKWQQVPDFLANGITGDVNYNGSFTVNKEKEGQVDLAITSDLQGGSLGFPEPFSKVAKSTEAFSLNLTANSKETLIDTKYGSNVKARFSLQSGQFFGGEVSFNSDLANAKPMMKGLFINGQFKAISVSQWMKVFDQASSQKSVSTLNEDDIALPDWLAGLNLLVDAVDVNDENTLHNFKVNYHSSSPNRALKINSDELNVIFDHDGQTPRLHFGYLSWNTKQDDSSGGPFNPPFHVSQIPHIILMVDQLYINQKPYGDWQLTLTKHDNQLVIAPFTSKLKNGSFDGRLVWNDDGKASNVNLSVSIQGKDLAELTSKFSQKAFVTSKKFKIKVALKWNGHPLYFDRPSLSGNISFNAKEGNFSQVDELPAFMKIFGIFNVDALKRRLSLDFSDVYKPGLTYDTFEGDFAIKDGILKTTKPLHVVSPTAEVTIEGEANLVTEQLNETLTGTLPITRSLPLAGLLWGTPQLAGILYLTDKLIGDKLSKVTSVQYKVEGPFDSPVVTPVKHTPVKRVEH